MDGARERDGGDEGGSGGGISCGAAGENEKVVGVKQDEAVMMEEGLETVGVTEINVVKGGGEVQGQGEMETDGEME